MPHYNVIVAIGKLKKVVKAMQPSAFDAEREVKNQYPDGNIVNVERVEEVTRYSAKSGNRRPLHRGSD